ncbi:MAG: cobalamin-binding protein [Myxococcota bacterium]|nr:cobalamin-binding protein [Myxococcota bacterium]
MRIVSLLPSTTELACALGLDDQLVGISHECDYPNSITKLPALTSSIIPHGLDQAEIDLFVRKAVREGRSLYAVNGELLRELEPDLILTQGLCDVCAVTPETIEVSLKGVRCAISSDCHVLSTEGTSVAGIFADVRRIAKAAGVSERAETLISASAAQLEAIQAPTTAPRVLGLEWIDPFFSAGHWVPEQIQSAGGVSVIGTPTSHSRTLSLDEVCESNPDIIVVLCCGFDLTANKTFAKQLLKRQELMTIKAIQNHQVWAIDANSFCSRPTLRVIEGAKIMAQIFKGEPVNESHALRIQ